MIKLERIFQLVIGLCFGFWFFGIIIFLGSCSSKVSKLESSITTSGDIIPSPVCPEAEIIATNRNVVELVIVGTGEVKFLSQGDFCFETYYAQPIPPSNSGA